MNPFFIIFSAGVICYWLFILIAKRVKRRCANPRCGRIFSMVRLNQIRLGSGETISLRSPEGRLRYYIRRVETETFAICTKCGHGRSIKVSGEAISCVHAKWVWCFNRQQYYEDPKLGHISFHAARQRNNRTQLDPDKDKSDTPPLHVIAEVAERIERILDPGNSEKK